MLRRAKELKKKIARTKGFKEYKKTLDMAKFSEEKQKQVVERLGEPTVSYEAFTASLPADECRTSIL